MASKHYYSFKLENGSIEMYTLEEAFQKRGESNAINVRLEEILQNLKNRRMVKDGFTPGFQANINEYCGGRLEYNKRLKELGLREIGKDYIPQDVSTFSKSPFANPEIAAEVKRLDPTFSDKQLDAISTGEFFADKSDVDLGD